LEKGYHISHVGMFCWCPLPTAGLVPRARGFFLLLEAVFAIIFHACTKMITDVYVQDALLWPRDVVSWEPLCSHLSLNEAIRGGLSLTAEELELAAAIRAFRLKHLSNKHSQNRRAKQREEDLDGYRAKVTKEKTAWNYKNPDKVLKIAAKVRNKAKDEERFYCDDCRQPFASQSALDRHNHTQSHVDCVAGLEKPAITKSAIAVNAVREQAKNDKLHHCSACDKSFGNDYGLQRHLATPLHAKKLAKTTGAAATTS
jgi:hypothetical protein